jgi:putative hydrolase of the HAD superfamily
LDCAVRAPLLAITLDLDDTLWAISPAIERAEVALRDFLASRAPRSAAFFTQADDVHQLRKHLVRGRPELLVDLGAFRRTLIGSILSHCEEDISLVEPAFEVFYQQRNQVDHYPDTLDALRRLSAKYRLMALTNGNADIHRVGIAHFFEASLGAADLGVAKPDPRIFHAALERLELAPAQVLHVGDDPQLDVEGAVKAGLPAVWMNREGKRWPLSGSPTHQVADLTALCDWLGC